MTMIIDGTNGLTFPDSSQQYNSYYGFKNRIINGAMVIDQRATTLTATGFSVDRWQYAASVSAKASVAQSTIVPSGFVNSLGVTSSSAYTVGSGELFVVRQTIEGTNIADLGWGTANATTITLSFWVRSSLTGTFGGALLNSAENRSYPFTYTISAANTWEQKSVTIAGDTSGTWLTTNGAGVKVTFGVGVGSTASGTAGSWSGNQFYSATGATSVLGTNGATFYITGVQLEKGSTATSFDYRPYGTELQLCQRYYFKISGGAGTRLALGQNNLTTQAVLTTTFPVTMRAAPSALEQSGTASDYDIQHANTATTCSSVPFFSSANQYMGTSGFTVASGLTVGQGSSGRPSNTSGYLAWSAEL